MVTIDPILLTLRVEMRFANLTSNSTTAHFHCCSAPGFNSVVAIQAPSFANFPTGFLTGTYDQTFDLTVGSIWNPAFVTNNGGTITSAYGALSFGLDSGRGYVDIHNAVYPGGEIRALLIPVPEPSTDLAILAGAAASLTLTRRRARR